MPSLFPRWSNTAMLLAVACGLTALVGVPAFLLAFTRSPHATGQAREVEQPVEFDHRHHVGDDGIACGYCHETAERGPIAGIPATEVCMGCHAQVWNDSPLLEPVRRSWFTGEPIAWRRVHDLPDFVYFDHSIHLHAGVDCESCHGRVDRMARVVQVAPLTMSWCLDCHCAAPERYGAPARVHCTACHR